MGRISLVYVECDLPEGVTLAEFRRASCPPRPCRRLRLRRLLGRRGAAA